MKKFLIYSILNIVSLLLLWFFSFVEKQRMMAKDISSQSAYIFLGTSFFIMMLLGIALALGHRLLPIMHYKRMLLLHVSFTILWISCGIALTLFYKNTKIILILGIIVGHQLGQLYGTFKTKSP